MSFESTERRLRTCETSLRAFPTTMDADPQQTNSYQGDQRNTPGRGSSLRIANRFESIHVEDDFEQLEESDQLAEKSQKVKTEYLVDRSGSVVNENSSPDVDFKYSLNPYRGCVHGCSYCYARPTHEYLGYNAGIDFESKIIIKPEAPSLFKKWINRPKWRTMVEPIMLSGVTDCYQPCEKKFEITRECLKVARDAHQPMRLITKNVLIQRDLDLLVELAELDLVCVTFSLASLNQPLIRKMEPRSSSPRARLKAIERLTQSGVPVKVLVAPIIPAINDDEIPEILKQVAAVGATIGGYVMLRLPHSVEPVFIDWLGRQFPDRKEKILARVKSLGGGKLYDSKAGNRMKGQGIWAEQIKILFDTCCKRNGLDRVLPRLNCDIFRGSQSESGRQLDLF